MVGGKILNYYTKGQGLDGKKPSPPASFVKWFGYRGGGSGKAIEYTLSYRNFKTFVECDSFSCLQVYLGLETRLTLSRCRPQQKQSGCYVNVICHMCGLTRWILCAPYQLLRVTSTEVGPGNLLVCTGIAFLFWCSSLISLGPSFLLPGPYL